MKNLIIFIFLILSVFGNAQSNYYSSDGKDRHTEEGLKELVELMNVEINKKLARNLEKKLYTHVNVERMELRRDSLINFIAFEFTDEKPTSFINYASSPVYRFYKKELSEFSLKTIEGNSLTNRSLKGKPTLINFWFTSCIPCIEEMPILNQLREKYKDDFNFVAVTFEKKEQVEKFLYKIDFDFIHVFEAQSFIDKLGIKSFPRNLFLDQNGILRNIENGISYQIDSNQKMKIGDSNEFIEIIEELIK